MTWAREHSQSSVSQFIDRFHRLPNLSLPSSSSLCASTTPHVFPLLLSQSPTEQAQEIIGNKKRSTFQRALARVRSLHSGPGQCPCQNPSRAQDLPSHFIPLSYFMYSMYVCMYVCARVRMYCSLQ